jgi:hypothetical protein
VKRDEGGGMRDELSRNALRALMFCAAFLFLAQVLFSAGPHDSPAVLTVGSVDAKPVAAGDSTRVRIILKIARGYHVNANPAASDFYIPLEVKLADTAGIRIGATHYPKGKKWRLAGTDEDLLVYGGAVTVDVPVAIAKDAKIGEQMLSGSVDFQACTDEMCLMPDSLPLRIKIVVQK